jgi:hypothetical protein
VAASSRERTAFLSIRARIVSTLDTSGRERTATAAARKEEIEGTVARWLDAFISSAR